jgi:hypothetical protein
VVADLLPSGLICSTMGLNSTCLSPPTPPTPPNWRDFRALKGIAAGIEAVFSPMTAAVAMATLAFRPLIGRDPTVGGRGPTGRGRVCVGAGRSFEVSIATNSC